VNDRLRRRIQAYPGNLTYLDLIRRNRRESALILAAVVVLGVVLGAVIASALALRAGAAGPEDLLPSVALGGLAALVTALIASAWSWFGGAGAILAMSGAEPLRKDDDPELFNVVEEIAIAAGLPMPRVYVIPEAALNAFATGRGPAHAAIAITSGLRQRLTRDELQGVMAHEMAHVRHLDVRFGMLLATLVGLIVFACDAAWRVVLRGGRSGRKGKGGGAAVLVVLAVALLLAVVAPLVSRLMQLAYSRRREYLADAGAVELTRHPEGLASALGKLAEDAQPLVESANRGTAHLYIVNPLRRMRLSRQSLDTIFSSHPPIQERIARLLALTR
jgi:heat shock protein HtpX